MILVDIYPNESVYSWLCRLFIRSGYTKPKDFLNEVYKGKRSYPSLFFIGALDEEFIKSFKKVVSHKKLLLEHTLFKYYVRFLDLNRKKNIYKRALNNESGIENLIPIEMGKNDYFLRYCPKCVIEDRNTYGEAYFHIEHAFPKVHICAKHKCELIDTCISGIDYRRGTFVSLEEVVDSLEIREVSEQDIKYRVAKYMNDLFYCGLDLKKDIRSGDYLSSRLKDKYIKKNYGERDNVLLAKELNIFYSGLDGFEITVNKIQALLLNKSWNSYDLALVALFENIRPYELSKYKNYKNVNEVIAAVDWKKLDEEYTNKFIEKTKDFNENDKFKLDRNWICKELNLEYSVLVHHFPKLLKTLSEIKGKKRNWEELDKIYCEQLNNLYKNNRERFVNRILTFEYIAQVLGISLNKFRKLPNLRIRSREIIIKNTIKANRWTRSL